MLARRLLLSAYGLGGFFLPGIVSGASLRRTTANNLAVPQDTWVAVAYDLAVWDTDGYWSAGSPTLLTAPFNGIFLFGANGRWDAGQNSTAGVRNQWIGKSGETPSTTQALAEVEWPSSSLTGALMMQPLIGPPTVLNAGESI